MAGHNKWKQIKEKKGVLDKKRSALFSKLLKAVAVAAREEPKPEFNPRLKAAIERARQANVPQENIERAIRKTSEADNLEEVTVEAYGPGGTALIIEATTDNRNRTIQKVKSVLKEHGGRLAEPGATAWAFETQPDKTRVAKFEQELNEEDKNKATELIRSLEGLEDIEKIYDNFRH